MSADETQKQRARGVRREGRRRGRRGRGRGRWLAHPLAVLLELALVAALAGFVVLMVTEGRRVPVPDAVAAWLETRAAEALGAELEIGALWLVAEGEGRLSLRGENVTLRGGTAGAGLTVPAFEAALEPAVLTGRISAPRRLVVEGAQLDLRRGADGRIDLGFGALALGTGPGAPRLVDVDAAIGRVQAVFARPALAPLREVVLREVALRYRDAVTGQTRRLDGGEATLTRGDGRIALALAAELPGRVALRATISEAGRAEATLSLLVDGVPAADLAAQAPQLAWLAPLDAPVSGALIGRLAPGGALGPLDGTLRIGPGRLSAGGAALPFESAAAFFAFRPETGRIAFETLELSSPQLTLAASGHADLADPDARGRPAALEAQLALARLRLDLPGRLPAPVMVAGGAADVRLETAPLRLRLGQLLLPVTEPAPIKLRASGTAAAGDGGWSALLDIAGSDARPEAVLGLWPVGAVPRTREWVARNLLAGELRDARAGIRLVPGAPPDIGVTFGFDAARLRPLGGLPPIEGAAGRAEALRDAFALTLRAGTITPPEGGPMDVSGTSFRIPDTRARPGRGTLRWRSESTVTAALSLIDQPPLELLQAAGRQPDLAEGRVALSGEIAFPIRPGVTPADVDFALGGTLADIRSEALVPGRIVTAERMALDATPRALELTGAARVDGARFEGRYRQPFGRDAGPVTLAGRVTLPAEAAPAFGLSAPPGTLTGAATGDLALTLPADGPPRLAFASDLAGLGLSLPALGWSKPPGATGAFDLAGTLGQPARFERLSLIAPGLSLAGSLALAEGGGLGRLALDSARIGGWFDGPLALEGRGAGRPPALRLGGGTLDLAAAPLAGGGGGPAPGNALGPVSGRLDRLRLAEGVALTDLDLALEPGAGGLSGGFSGRANGGPAVTGRVAPGRGGRPRLNVTSEDAGGVLAAIGAFDEARGGAFDLTLAPATRADAWDGTLTVRDVRVTAAPGLATLLNAISVVGLIEQLEGPGLLFSTVRAGFRLTPGLLELTEASAVGNALGISARGQVDLAARRLDIEGVLSPIYAVNAIGRVFSREGEGLFGVNYDVEGPLSAPRFRVNPLSVLTPGAFREIFRAPPPEPAAR